MISGFPFTKRHIFNPVSKMPLSVIISSTKACCSSIIYLLVSVEDHGVFFCDWFNNFCEIKYKTTFYYSIYSSWVTTECLQVNSATDTIGEGLPMMRIFPHLNFVHVIRFPPMMRVSNVSCRFLGCYSSCFL